MMARTKSVGVLLISGQKVLLVRHTEKAKHQTGAYGFPAGRVRVIESETEKQAAVRELAEETGLKISEENLYEFPGNYVESTLVMKHEPENFSYRVFLGRNWSGELSASAENVPEWMDIDQLKNLKLTSSNVPEIAQAGINFLKHDQIGSI